MLHALRLHNGNPYVIAAADQQPSGGVQAPAGRSDVRICPTGEVGRSALWDKVARWLGRLC